MLQARDLITEELPPDQMVDALYGLASETYLTLVLATVLLYDYCALLLISGVARR